MKEALPRFQAVDDECPQLASYVQPCWLLICGHQVERFQLVPQSHLLYGGRTLAVELQNRVIPAVAVEILRRATVRRIPIFYRPQGWPQNYSAEL